MMHYKEFRIRPAKLDRNHLFMDIHKDRMASRIQDTESPLEKFKDYRHRIGILFSDLPFEHRFWLATGESVQSLRELYEAMDTMSDDAYSHHIKGKKNDFAEWVETLYGDDKLAHKLRMSKTREQAKRAIEERIDELIKLEEKHDTEKGFFNALIQKFQKQNERLEKELFEKKEWLAKKEEELKKWESRNIDQEKRLYEKYQSLEKQEKELYERFKRLEIQQKKLVQSVEQEKAQVQKENMLVEEKRKVLEKEQAELEHRRRQQSSQENEELAKKHQHIYERLDELMSYAVTSVHNKNYAQTRDNLGKIKYYYNILPSEDPKKKDYYSRIVKLRAFIKETLKL